MARKTPVRCEISGRQCSIHNGRWSSANTALAVILEQYEKLSWVGGVRPPAPDQDYASAELMVKRLGGKIISDPEPESVPGRVY